MDNIITSYVNASENNRRTVFCDPAHPMPIQRILMTSHLLRIPINLMVAAPAASTIGHPVMIYKTATGYTRIQNAAHICYSLWNEYCSLKGFPLRMMNSDFWNVALQEQHGNLNARWDASLMAFWRSDTGTGAQDYEPIAEAMAFLDAVLEVSFGLKEDGFAFRIFWYPWVAKFILLSKKVNSRLSLMINVANYPRVMTWYHRIRSFSRNFIVDFDIANHRIREWIRAVHRGLMNDISNTCARVEALQRDEPERFRLAVDQILLRATQQERVLQGSQQILPAQDNGPLPQNIPRPSIQYPITPPPQE